VLGKYLALRRRVHLLQQKQADSSSLRRKRSRSIRRPTSLR
jgi:hypothetical protein